MEALERMQRIYQNNAWIRGDLQGEIGLFSLDNDGRPDRVHNIMKGIDRVDSQNPFFPKMEISNTRGYR